MASTSVVVENEDMEAESVPMNSNAEEETSSRSTQTELTNTKCVKTQVNIKPGRNKCN